MLKVTTIQSFPIGDKRRGFIVETLITKPRQRHLLENRRFPLGLTWPVLSGLSVFIGNYARAAP